MNNHKKEQKCLSIKKMFTVVKKVDMLKNLLTYYSKKGEEK
jgi:hypothetical protein